MADLININNFPSAAIPGVIDGKVLTESIGTALAHGRFAHVPNLNGINRNEEWLFTAGLGLAVSGVLKATIGSGYVLSGYSATTAAARSGETARTAAMSAVFTR